MNILILEDHADVRESITLFLQDEGHDVLAFTSAESADCQIDHLRPDVAILDVRLPGRTGDEFGRELVQRFPDTRIIFATGEHDLSRLKTAVPGCFVLRKPVDLDVLSQMLKCMAEPDARPSAANLWAAH